LVGVDQFVHKVLLRGILVHLDTGSSNYSGVVGARLGLHAEELPEEYPVGLDAQESFAKMNEDGGMEDTIGVEIEVLDTVVLQEPLEEVARRESQPALHEPREHRISSGFFSIEYGSPAAARHMSTSFSRRNPLLSSASKSSVLAFDFFHSLLGFGRGGETGGVDPSADPAASFRDLFFPPAVFMLLDGEAFILQVHQVFTRIRSGAAVVVIRGGVPGSTIYTEVAMCTRGGF
jgi:hypothetical protein